MNQLAFKVLWVVGRPLRKFFVWVEKSEALTKPNVLLKSLIWFAVASLYFENKVLWQLLTPKFNFIFVAALAMVVVVYFWKHLDSSLGEPWKRDYNELLRKEGMKNGKQE